MTFWPHGTHVYNSLKMFAYVDEGTVKKSDVVYLLLVDKHRELLATIQETTIKKVQPSPHHSVESHLDEIEF